MARRNVPIAEFSMLWQRHETLYRGIFIEALNQLNVTDGQRKYEDDISEALCPVLRKICFLDKNKPAIPQWERPISPGSFAELKGGKSSKRPDFTCSLTNTFATTQEMHEISLHVECKRLGKKNRSKALNENYIKNGVKRFDTLTHEYGKRSPSGMMVGYIINSDRHDILCQVNRHLSCTALPEITFAFKKKVESCDMIISRCNVEPKNFKLIHIWTDLRPTTHQAADTEKISE